jgi:dienelactone hydrolase
MKRFIFHHIYLILVVFSGLILNSCKDNNDPFEKNYENYLSNELKVEFTRQDAVDNMVKIAPEAVLLSPLIKYDVEVRKLTYKTVFRDKNISASGLVCLPKSPGDFPVISFQNGTNTLHADAPSEKVDDDLFAIIESITSMGFIVVIPDYIGFGASASLPHPYLDAKSTTQSILDLLRATKEYTSDDKVQAKFTKDLFIFGYSQGGWATMQLQKSIEKDYSSEFNLIASSCGSGPYSIEYMNRYIVEKDEYPMPFFIAYVLNSYKTIGLISNPLSDMIKEPYATLIPGLFDGTNSGGTINSKLTTKMADLFTAEYRTGFATNTKFAGLKSALLSNSVTAWKATTPMKLFHGAKDEYIPVGVSQEILLDFKTAGVSDSQIQLMIFPEADHTTGVYPTGLETIKWFLSLKK